jgi:hypothetical protein
MGWLLKRFRCWFRGHGDFGSAPAYGRFLPDGALQELYFCGRCGSPVWVSKPAVRPTHLHGGFVTLKVLLDQIAKIKSLVHRQMQVTLIVSKLAWTAVVGQLEIKTPLSHVGCLLFDITCAVARLTFAGPVATRFHSRLLGWIYTSRRNNRFLAGAIVAEEARQNEARCRRPLAGSGRLAEGVHNRSDERREKHHDEPQYLVVPANKFFVAAAHEVRELDRPKDDERNADDDPSNNPSQTCHHDGCWNRPASFGQKNVPIANVVDGRNHTMILRADVLSDRERSGTRSE